ncbi:MAG: hypothetical protein Q7Q71_05255 [Verrucomicrobiota bacterium JB023]|nr:hypothetical protein [Verrucomicrobiota bacterium JB023]
MKTISLLSIFFLGSLLAASAQRLPREAQSLVNRKEAEIYRINAEFVSDLQKLEDQYRRRGQREQARQVRKLIEETPLGYAGYENLRDDLANGRLDERITTGFPVVGMAYRLPIKKQKLAINREHGRRHIVPIATRGLRRIELTFWNADDNSGDKGLHWRIEDALTSRIIARGFASKEKAQSWSVEGLHTHQVNLIIEDHDSDFSGHLSGNGFMLEVKPGRSR